MPAVVPVHGGRGYIVCSPPDLDLFSAVARRRLRLVEALQGDESRPHRPSQRPQIRLPACHGAFESTILAYRLYNIGESYPVALLKYIELIEEFLGRHGRSRANPIFVVVTWPIAAGCSYPVQMRIEAAAMREGLPEVQYLVRFFGEAAPGRTGSFGQAR